MAQRRKLFSGRIVKKPPPPPPPAVQPPSNTIPANTTTFVSTPKVFSLSDGSAVQVADPDSPVLACTVTTDLGTIEVGLNPGVKVTGNNSSKVTLSGSPANINISLNGMKFTPLPGIGGVATITVRTSDGKNIDTDSFTVTITGAAPPPPAPGPAPQNNLPGPQTVVTGGNLALAGLSIADADTTFLTTTLNVANGRVTVSTSGGANVLGNGSSLVTLGGTVAQINSALASAVFVSNQGFVGKATITMSTSDGETTDVDILEINVTSAGTPAPAPGPASPPYYPFGSRLDLANGRYPVGALVSNRSTATMDTDLKNKYVQWRQARIYNVPNISGAKAVKFSNDPYPNTTKALTVSEGMGYGMLLSVLFEDQATFDGLLRLVRARPAYAVPKGTARPDLYLMDWRLGPNAESNDTYGGGWPATDGDLDITMALLMADRQWGNANTTWNYKTEALRNIAAIKEWYFQNGSLTAPFGSSGSDVVRTSDFMFGHFRAFKEASGDTFWTSTVIPRLIAINEKCQTVFSAANGGPGCFVPDAIVNADGSLAGKPIGSLRDGTLPGNVTNFAAAFGLTGQTTYGSGTNNFTPSPGGRLDFVATEMHLFANAWRCPFRWAADVAFSNDAAIKAQCARLVNYLKANYPNPAGIPIGFRLNGGLQGPQGGAISMGNAWPNRALIAGAMVAAMLDGNSQSYVNACYDWLMANWTTDYYDSELMLMPMAMAAGNWWSYPGLNAGAGAGVGAPVNTVPAAQTVTAGATKTFSASWGNQISVTDPNSSTLTVTLSAQHGTLKAIGGGGGTLADGFPSKIIAGYWPFWQTEQRLINVSQNFNVVYLFAARAPGINSGDGTVYWELPGWPTSADVQTLRARGQKVILSVGGADHGYVYDTRTKSTNLVNSLISIINSFGGVDGVDYNFYEGGIVTEGNKVAVAAELVWISQQLRAQYGSKFGILSPPAPHSTIDQYLMQQLHLNNVLTFVSPQYYAWSLFKQVGYISGLSGGQNNNLTWVNLFGGAANGGERKVVVGMSSNFDYNSSLTLAECNREWDAVVAAFPNERGVMCWNTQLDAQIGNQWVNNFKAKIGATGGSGATITNNESTVVTITGTIGEINAALDGLVYTPASGYTGPDTITISSSDGINTDTDSIAMTIGTTYSFEMNFDAASPMLRWDGGPFYPYFTYYGGNPQPEGIDGFRWWNDEQQVYTSPLYTPAPYNPLSISGGTLKITAIPKGTTYAGSPQPYLSGCIETSKGPFWDTDSVRNARGGFEQKYGYWEVRAKIPKSKGVWCAFYLDGGITYNVTPGNQHAEIDVFETISDGKVYQTIHDWWAATPTSEEGIVTLGHEAAFHTYGLLWTPDAIVWFIDGVETFRASAAMVQKYRDTAGPMFLAIGQAIGGGWPGNPDGTTVFPSVMEIDYIRVQPYVAAGTPPPPPPPPAPPPSGSTGADVLLSYFGGGNGGAWLDPQPISVFNTTANSGVALSAYNNYFGRWKDRSGRGHDFIEVDDYSRPTAKNDGGYPYGSIYHWGPVQGAGGTAGAFYLCMAIELDPGTYYGTWLSDKTSANNGIRLGHDADQAGTGTGDLYVSVGNGSTRVTARCKSNMGNYTTLSGKHVIEAWWAGPGNPLTIRLDMGEGAKTGTATLNAVAKGGADMVLGADGMGGVDFSMNKWFQLAVIKDACPTQTERDLIAQWVGSKAGLTLGSTAPAPTPAPAPAPAPVAAGHSLATFSQPAGSTSITSKGAVAGGANCLTAIQSAIDTAAGTATKTVWVPSGEWHWSGGLIHVHSGVKLVGAGATQSVLYADDYLGCSVFMEGDGSSVYQLKLTGAVAPAREAAWSRTRITVMGATNYVIKDCWLEGSPAAGIHHARSSGDTGTACSGGYIAFNTIKNTLADSIHCTNGVTNLIIEFNSIDNSGDDGVACVSYDYDIAPCTFITARHNVIKNNASGRNMSVVGGEDIYYYNNYLEVNNNNNAGIYIAQEGGYSSRPCKRVKVELNTVKNCGGTVTGHAEIMVFSDGTYSGGVPNDDIWLLRNDLVSSGTKANVNGIRYYGPQTNVKLDQNRYTGSGTAVVSTGGGTTITVNSPYTSGAIGYTQPTA